MYIVIKLDSLTWRKRFELPALLLLCSGTFYWVRIRAACSQALPYHPNLPGNRNSYREPGCGDRSGYVVVLRQAEVSVKGPFVLQAGRSRLV